jgi:hypothetical protein
MRQKGEQFHDHETHCRVSELAAPKRATRVETQWTAFSVPESDSARITVHSLEAAEPGRDKSPPAKLDTENHCKLKRKRIMRDTCIEAGRSDFLISVDVI